MNKSVLIILGLFVFSLGIVSAGSCTYNSDCASGEVCRDGECTSDEDGAPCNENADCSLWGECSFEDPEDAYGICIAAGACSQDSDCDRGYACNTVLAEGACYGSCTSDEQCSADAACVINDEGSGLVGECMVCEDSDGGIDTSLQGEVTGVFLTNSALQEDLVDTCQGKKVKEYFCEDTSGDNEEEYGTPGHLYAYLNVVSCDSGYSCKNGACAKSTTSLTKTTKFKAGEYSSSSPWLLGTLGILLIGGAAYWFFAGRKSEKKAKKK